MGVAYTEVTMSRPGRALRWLFLAGQPGRPADSALIGIVLALPLVGALALGWPWLLAAAGQAGRALLGQLLALAQHVLGPLRTLTGSGG